MGAKAIKLGCNVADDPNREKSSLYFVKANGENLTGIFAPGVCFGVCLEGGSLHIFLLSQIPTMWS